MMSAFITAIQQYTRGSSHHSGQEKEIKGLKIRKEEVKLLRLADNIIVCVENCRGNQQNNY